MIGVLIAFGIAFLIARSLRRRALITAISQREVYRALAAEARADKRAHPTTPKLSRQEAADMFDEEFLRLAGVQPGSWNPSRDG